MPRKGMRTVFFKQSSPLHKSSASPIAPRLSFCESLMEDRMAAAEILVSRWNPDSSDLAKITSLFHHDRHEASLYLKAIRDLHSSMRIFIKNDPSSPALHRAQKLMQIAMKRLEKEFYQILAVNRDILDPESVSVRSSRMSTVSSTDFEFDVETVSKGDEYGDAGESIAEVEKMALLATGDLKEIADCMIALGYGKECVGVYKIIRKSIIDEGLYRLGVERLNSTRMNKMDWEIVEMKIADWLAAVRTSVTVLFSGERILIEHIFSASESVRESCFSEITKDGAQMLLGFPELVANIKKTPEKVFRTLDLYEAIVELWPEIESIFSFESTSDVRNQAIASVGKLGESVRTMLENLESLIQIDKLRSATRGGGVHPITGYVMNYLSLLGEYAGVLTDISNDWPLKVQSPLSATYLGSFTVDEGPAHSIAVRIAWIVLVLLCKIDEKAKKLYKDAGLCFLFLANNLQYAVNIVRTSNLKKLLGKAWLEKHTSKVGEYSLAYERTVWRNVIAVLPESPSPEISPEEARRKIVVFNREFKMAYEKQVSWKVPDRRQREYMRNSIERKLVPPYVEFYERFRRGFRDRKGKVVVVRLTPDVLQNYLSDLFHDGEGGTRSATSSSSSESSGF